MQLINLTPHAINFVAEDGTALRTIEPSGTLARVSTSTVTIGDVDGIPVTTTSFGEVEGLPEPKEGTAYVVSSLVAQRVPQRGDVYIPNESVRDEHGRIVGCKSLGRVTDRLREKVANLSMYDESQLEYAQWDAELFQEYTAHNKFVEGLKSLL